jgi:hypothetical protein
MLTSSGREISYLEAATALVFYLTASVKETHGTYREKGSNSCGVTPTMCP